MPTTYNYRENTSRVACSNCGNARTFAGRYPNAEIPAGEGGLVREFIRFLPARQRFHSWCRDCERAAAAARPNRNSRRTGTTRRRIDRPFAVEIECKFPRGRTRAQVEAALAAAGVTNWRVKGDGSLTRGNGMEICPRGALVGEAGFEQLRTVCRVLKEQGASVDRQCGTHIHLDVADLDVASFKRFGKTWANNQPMIDGLVSPARREAAQPYYCRAWTSSDADRLDGCNTLADIRSRGWGRYKTLNLNAYAIHGTVEVRQHQGTLNPEKMTSWIKLGQALIDASKVQAVPAQSRIRDLVTRLADMLDETAATFILGRAVQFNAVPV